MFLDIGLGIVSSILVSEYFGIPLHSSLVISGILFALLPDADLMIRILQRKSIRHNAYEHRSILHLPLLYIPIGAAVLFLIFGQTWALLFAFASFFHFAHDSFGIGRGVEWLYPFSKNGYAFLYMHSRKTKRGLWQWIFVFDKEAIERFDAAHGDDDWIKNIYLSWHPFSLFEYVGFLLSIILLYFYVR
ncbi:MAG: metal-dependent hydrolase [Candidatus Moranbacteria bacterium]|nr:metal-dependent hydrolase [Candidatus Moranbacteria bacterium]